MDLIYRMMGRKPFLVKISSLMQKSQKALEPFTTNSWDWTHGNMDKLWEELSQEDREIFPFDLRELDWSNFLETYVQVNNAQSEFKDKSNAICIGNKKISVQRGPLHHPRLKETS